MTGLSRAKVTRLIARYQQEGQVRERGYRRNQFERRYTAADVELLAAVDEAHETLSGPTTQKILYREFYEYGDARYRRLASISVAHIYHLRKSPGYRKRRMAYQKTRPVQVAIGERRRPNPEGQPGYLRIDTVHQGDLDGIGSRNGTSSGSPFTPIQTGPLHLSCKPRARHGSARKNAALPTTLL
jgi:hypothetical protein